MTDSISTNIRTRFFVFLGLLILFSVLAVVLRYPTSLQPDAVPLDPNFPLHALAAQDLVSGGSPFINTHLEWPDGAPIRYLAWPLLIIAMFCNLLWEPIPAMNLAIVVWLMLQGVGMTYLFQSLLNNWLRSILAAILALSGPQILLGLGNSQFENVAPFFLLLIGWSTLHKRNIWLLFGLFGACFSSPYMGLLGFLLTLCLGYRRFTSWAAIGLTSAAVWAYFQRELLEKSYTQPAPSSLSESARPLELWIPTNSAENGGVSLSYGLDRLRELAVDIPTAMYDASWFWVMVTASGFIGVSWTIFGVLGLWSKRKDPIVKGLTIWGILALLISFGDVLYINEDLQFHWIWQISNWLPGLSKMNATYRFLAAPSLLLALGVVCVGNRWLVIVGTFICLSESLLMTPAHWPVPVKYPKVPTEIKDFDQPFVFWPPPPVISTYKVTLTGLLLDQPIALFSEQGIGIPKADGQLPELGSGLNRKGETLDEWVAKLIDNKVNKIVYHKSFHDRLNSRSRFSKPIPIKVHQRRCYESYCISLLVQPRDDY